jgi:hypothetical protein
MGGNSSKSSVEQTRDYVNEFTSDFLVKNTTKVSAVNINTNEIIFKAANIKNCTLTANMKINATTSSSGQLTQQVSDKLMADLTTKLQTEVDNQASQKTGFLAVNVENSVSSQSTLKESIKNTVKSTFESDTYNEIVSKSMNSNRFDAENANIDCGTRGNIAIDQNIFSNVVASSIADLVTTNLTSLITDNTSTTKVTQSATQQNQGLNDLVDSVFNGIAKIFSGWVGIVIVAILLCVSLASSSFAAMKMKGGGDAASASFPYQMPSKV